MNRGLIQFKSLLFVVLLFQTELSFGAFQCAALLSTPAPQSMNIQVLTEVVMLKRQLAEAQDLDEANDHIYSMVVVGNKALDQAFDILVALNVGAVPAAQVQQQTANANRIFQEVSELFHIPVFVFEQAVNNRLELERLEYIAKVESAKARQALGFGREESHSSFHAEDGKFGYEIGFQPLSKDNSDTEDLKITPGFGSGPKSLELGHFEYSIGFKVLSGKSSKSAAESAKEPKPALGFANKTKEEPAEFKSEDVDRIKINIKRGELQVSKT